MRAFRSAWRCVSVSRSVIVRRRPGRSGSGGGESRPASHRLPSRITSETRNAMTNSQNWDPRRVQNTPSNPTDLYQMASVQRSTPKPARRTMSATITIAAAMPSRRRIQPMEIDPAPSSGPPTGRGDRGPSGGLPAPEVVPAGRRALWRRLPDPSRGRIGTGSLSSSSSVSSPCPAAWSPAVSSSLATGVSPPVASPAASAGASAAGASSPGSSPATGPSPSVL